MAELKNKFNRIASDASQAQQFADKVCDSLDNGEGEFNKVLGEEQIKGLIKQALESGEIKVKGTLYRHSFGDGESDIKFIEFISTSPDPIDLSAIVDLTGTDFFQEFKIIQFVGKNETSLDENIMNSNPINLWYDSENQAIGFSDGDSSDSIPLSDLVADVITPF